MPDHISTPSPLRGSSGATRTRKRAGRLVPTPVPASPSHDSIAKENAPPAQDPQAPDERGVCESLAGGVGECGSIGGSKAVVIGLRGVDLRRADVSKSRQSNREGYF